MHWDGQSLTLNLDEVSVPLPFRVRGTVRVWPKGLSRFVAPLDTAGRHRWGPIAACARVEVNLSSPELRWGGAGYLDSNEGDEPVARAFKSWDWSRAPMANGSTGVLYDVREKNGDERMLALRFAPAGEVEQLEAPPRQALPGTLWRVARQVRADAPTKVIRTLEDTPFYVRSELLTSLLGERVTAVHESLDVQRLESSLVQFMLPWRMPRRA